jgi:hypothetical protein
MRDDVVAPAERPKEIDNLAEPTIGNIRPAAR